MSAWNSGSRERLMDAGRWDDLADLLTDIHFLEAEVQGRRVAELAEVFSRAAGAMPPGHPKQPFLRVLGAALRADLDFIARHPETLFQCLWNRCWWHDSPRAAEHYEPLEDGWPAGGAPWEQPGPKLSALVESWREIKAAESPDLSWVRSLRPLPFPLDDRQLAVIRGDWRQLNGLTFSADGRRVIAWVGDDSDSGVPRVWEWDSGSELTGRRTSLPLPEPAVSPDGRLRLRNEPWEFPRLCDAVTGKTVKDLGRGGEWDECVSCVAFSPDGRLVAAGTYDEECCGAVRVWDASTAAPLAGVGTSGMPWGVAFSPDGRSVVSGDTKGVVQVWAVPDGRSLVRFTGHEGSVDEVAFSPDGRHIVSGSDSDGTIRVWELGEAVPVGRLKGHPDGIQEVVFSTDGRRLVTRSENQTTWLWDAVSGAPVSCLHRSSAVVFMGGGAINSIWVNGERVLHFSIEGIKVWDADAGREISMDRSSRYYASCRIVFSPDGRRCFLNEHGATAVILTSLDCGRPARLDGHQGPITCAAFSPDSSRIATASEDGSVRLWDVSGESLAVLNGHKERVTAVGFSPDGHRLVTGSVDQTVRTWDVAAGTELALLRPENPGVYQSGWSGEKGEYVIPGVSEVAFTADGRQVVTLSRFEAAMRSITQVTRVWDEQTGACLDTLEGVGSFEAVCSGHTHRAAAVDAEVRITSADSGELIGRFPATLHALAVSPSGRVWAGSIGKHFYHFELEGGNPSGGPRP